MTEEIRPSILELDEEEYMKLGEIACSITQSSAVVMMFLDSKYDLKLAMTSVGEKDAQKLRERVILALEEAAANLRKPLPVVIVDYLSTEEPN